MALEYALFYDKNGKVVFGVIGTESYVGLDKLDKNTYNVRGLNSSHNHPHGTLEFSHPDLAAYLWYHPSEVRVFTADGAISFHPDYKKLNSEAIHDYWIKPRKLAKKIIDEEYSELTNNRTPENELILQGTYRKILSIERTKKLKEYGEVSVKYF